MYYAFPKEYFFEVETRKDFEYNFIGENIDWESTNRKVKKLVGEEIIKEKYMENQDEIKLLEQIDDEYVFEELNK